jgi:two-component system nitrogen regulation response regulator NtrX
MKNSGSLHNSRVLIVDDHRNIRLSLQVILEAEGAVISEAATLASARQMLGLPTNGTYLRKFDLILLDIRLPDGNGLLLLDELKSAGVANHAVVISGEGTTQEAFRATNIGAFDFIEKPFTPERVLVSARRCIEFNRIEQANADLSKNTKSAEIIGENQKIKDVLAVVAKVGPTNGRVLITGESGTGKELIARAIHKASPRASKPMIKVNCAAIPKNIM